MRVAKSESAAGDGKRWLQGIASTDSKDLQGEVVKQSGIDTSYFLNYGYFNYDHKSGAEFKIGEPTECKVTPKGLWVKGFLYGDKKVADDVWEHITAIHKSGGNRRMGFSIEGKVVKRSANVIEKCWLQDVAITPAPVNATTWAEIAKSLSAQVWLPKDIAQDLTFEETVAYLRRRKGLAEEDASTLATLIFDSI